MTKETNLLLPGPQGQLEAILHQGDPALPMVVICHPHPLHQGTMHNKVVYMLSRAFAELSCSSLRFNYRGVGKSSGRYGKGEGESEDLLAVITWLHQHHSVHSLWLAGFSFGCYVVGRAAQQHPDKLQQLFMVAPAVNHLSFKQFDRFDYPLHIIHGDQDEVADYQAAYHWCQQLQSPAEFITVTGSSHFFHKKLLDLRQIIGDISASILDSSTIF
ncbi:MAG: alpha/beta fold hydrolase [Pseudomonadota bacterium]